MWTQMPQQQNLVYDHERVSYFTSSRGGAGLMMYTENDTTSNISGRVSAAGGAFQDAQVKGFIEAQRSDDYTGVATRAAGAGVPVIVVGSNAIEIWTLYLDANNAVVRGAGDFILS